MLRAHRISVVLVLSALAVLAACRKDDEEERCPETPSQATCVAGQQVACPCADGSMGIQVCVNYGRAFGACQCGAPSDGEDAGSDGGDRTDGGEVDADAG